MAHKVESDWSKMDPNDIPKGLRNYLDAPAAALAHSRREQLNLHLNVPRQDFSEAGLLKDWRGFAERLGFSALKIDNFARHSSPTSEVLREWIPQPNAKIGHLLEALCTMERFDILKDTNLMSFIEEDIKGYMRQEQRRREAEERNAINPLQVDQIQSSDDMEVDEYTQITINETPGNPEKFHAFLCYAETDLPFVRQMIDKLEGAHGLKLCVPKRDLVAGVAELTIIARLIKERCEKMIIVLSPEFKDSEECDFQTKFGLSLSPGARERKLIPVVYKSCVIPEILNHICLLDYTRCDVVDWFWNRLANSLKKESTLSRVGHRGNPRQGPRPRVGPHTSPVQSSRPSVGKPVGHHHTAPYRITGGAASAREGRIVQAATGSASATAAENVAMTSAMADTAATSRPTVGTIATASRLNAATAAGPTATAVGPTGIILEEDLLTNEMQMQHFAIEPNLGLSQNRSDEARGSSIV